MPQKVEKQSGFLLLRQTQKTVLMLQYDTLPTASSISSGPDFKGGSTARISAANFCIQMPLPNVGPPLKKQGSTLRRKRKNTFLDTYFSSPSLSSEPIFSSCLIISQHSHTKT